MKNKAADRRQQAEGWQTSLGTMAGLGWSERLLFFLAAPVMFVFCLAPAASGQNAKRAAAPEAPRGPLTYDSFKLIRTRNVFDPDRRPVRPTTAGPVAASGRADFLSLTGTLLDANKTYAFFSGSRTDFNKVLTVGDKIANSTVTQITSMNIVVEREGKLTTVNVGQTVPLDAKSAPGAAPVNYADVAGSSVGSAPPVLPVAGGSTSVPAAVGSAPAPGTPAPPSAGKGPSPNVEEIRRRMMEKRNQDLK